MRKHARLLRRGANKSKKGSSLLTHPLPLLNSRVPKGPYGRVPKGPLLISRACLRILNSRAPKGDGGLNSRACLRILSMAALSLTVEPLRSLWSST
jgi:hypothetical protein